jgi:hypothetical protein
MYMYFSRSCPGKKTAVMKIFRPVIIHFVLYLRACRAIISFKLLGNDLEGDEDELCVHEFPDKNIKRVSK